jgi:hypothetical protein
MQTRRKHFLVGVVVLSFILLLAAIVVYHLTRPQLFEGKSIATWIELLDAHVDHRAQHDQAAEVLVKIGEPVVPVIRELLRPPGRHSGEGVPPKASMDSSGDTASHRKVLSRLPGGLQARGGTEH